MTNMPTKAMCPKSIRIWEWLSQFLGASGAAWPVPSQGHHVTRVGTVPPSTSWEQLTADSSYVPVALSLIWAIFKILLLFSDLRCSVLVLI